MDFAESELDGIDQAFRDGHMNAFGEQEENVLKQIDTVSQLQVRAFLSTMRMELAHNTPSSSSSPSSPHNSQQQQQRHHTSNASRRNRTKAGKLKKGERVGTSAATESNNDGDNGNNNNNNNDGFHRSSASSTSASSSPFANNNNNTNVDDDFSEYRRDEFQHISRGFAEKEQQFSRLEKELGKIAKAVDAINQEIRIDSPQ